MPEISYIALLESTDRQQYLFNRIKTVEKKNIVINICYYFIISISEQIGLQVM
jgi:uncharacterized membrane protein